MFPMRLSPKNISFRGKATWKRMTNSIAIPMCSALKREMFTSSMSLIFIGNDGCWLWVIGRGLLVVGYCFIEANILRKIIAKTMVATI